MVKPALRDYDRLAFEATDAQHWPYQQFQSPFEGFHDDLLLADWTSENWFKFKVWSLARSCGRLPLALFGDLGLPRVLETCPVCFTAHADLQHCLAMCPAFEFDRQQLGYRARNWDKFRIFLFGGDGVMTGDGSLTPRICFVHKVFEQIVHALSDSD